MSLYRTIEKYYWKCPVCGEHYENEDDANCCHGQEAMTYDTYYQCPVCSEEYSSEENAETCMWRCKEKIQKENFKKDNLEITQVNIYSCKDCDCEFYTVEDAKGCCGSEAVHTNILFKCPICDNLYEIFLEARECVDNCIEEVSNDKN